MYSRFIDFIEINDILYKNQFGFQRGKSTEHALLDLYRNIVQSIKSEEKTSCIFLDFAKAFDTVNHEILLGKLEHYGIRALILIWFKSYLSNRGNEQWKMDSVSQTLKQPLLQSHREVY